MATLLVIYKIPPFEIIHLNCHQVRSLFIKMFCIRNTFMSHCKNLFKESTFKIRIKTTLLCTVSSNIFKNDGFVKPPRIPVKEILIPVPYGQLAAKAWGHGNGHPVFALHGWMNNCGTFDKLIPLLDKSLYIIALDLPGHGFSSHKPVGCFYTYIDAILAIQYAKDFLGWKSFHFIGHSMGGELAQMYAGFYPELVEKVILLDVVKPLSFAPKVIPERFVRAIDLTMEAEKKLFRNPSVYSSESAVEYMIKTTHNEITQESAKILLQRGARLSDCGTGQIYTRDVRVRNMEYCSIMSDPSLLELLSRIRSELLIIRANKTHPDLAPQRPDLDRIIIDMYTKNCKCFSLETVEGNHFVHLNNPERVAPLINHFLSV